VLSSGNVFDIDLNNVLSLTGGTSLLCQRSIRAGGAPNPITGEDIGLRQEHSHLNDIAARLRPRDVATLSSLWVMDFNELYP
jgi:hypothetical protein